jgi:hypothetical protein
MPPAANTSIASWPWRGGPGVRPSEVTRAAVAASRPAVWGRCRRCRRRSWPPSSAAGFLDGAGALPQDRRRGGRGRRAARPRGHRAGRRLGCGYHGWLDWCQADTAGVPAATGALRRVPFNEPAHPRAHPAAGDRLAAVTLSRSSSRRPTPSGSRAARRPPGSGPCWWWTRSRPSAGSRGRRVRALRHPTRPGGAGQGHGNGFRRRGRAGRGDGRGPAHLDLLHARHRMGALRRRPLRCGSWANIACRAHLRDGRPAARCLAGSPFGTR